MTVGELVFASVVDQRVYDAQGERGSNGVYLLGVPGRALPFVLYRAWKIGTGSVTESVDFYGPSGRLVHRWGPVVRRMLGTMDLTEERDLIADAEFDETGMYVVSFVIDDEIVGEIECPVFVQPAPTKLPKDIEDGLRGSDVIWVGPDQNGKSNAVPVWFVYRNGRIYVLSKNEPGPEEQTVPGIPGASDVIVVTRYKATNPERRGRDAALREFHATVRTLEGPEWEEAAKLLVDRRRSRHGPPAEWIQRWRGSCSIAELTPVILL
jgi:hypothetical protein